MNINEITLQAYENGLDEYNAAAIPEVTGSVKDLVDAGLDMLPVGAKILELGSAHGRDAAYMEGRGFKVDRTDAAHSFVNFMNTQGYEARVLDALTDNYGGPYDMVYANAVLLHFTAEQIPQVLSRVYESLAEHGLFSFSVKIGEGEGWSDAKLKSPRFFSYWHEQPLKDLLVGNHFDVVFWEEGKTGHDNGDWFHIIAKKL